MWARCNSVSWDNSALGLVVWIGIDSWVLWINLWVNSQAEKLSYFCVETYNELDRLSAQTPALINQESWPVCSLNSFRLHKTSSSMGTNTK